MRHAVVTKVQSRHHGMPTNIRPMRNRLPPILLIVFAALSGAATAAAPTDKHVVVVVWDGM
ncbi:MAG TPA: hypothetical protein VG103_06950, partial [Chthoniobacterales bacterium]|nr:hypothetical protein [Chthoniobacterales bacterium]